MWECWKCHGQNRGPYTGKCPQCGAEDMIVAYATPENDEGPALGDPGQRNERG